MVCTSWVKKFLLTSNAVAQFEAGNHVVSAVGWEVDRSAWNLSLLPPCEAVSVVASVVVVVVAQAVSVIEEADSGADVEVLVAAEEAMPPTEGTVVAVAVLGVTEEAEAVSVVTALRLAGIVAAAAADMDKIVAAVVSEVGSTADPMAAEVDSEAEAASEGETTRAEDPGKIH